MPGKLVVLAGMVMALLAAPAESNEAGVDLGSLDCAIEAGTGFIFGSTKDLRCTFTPANPEFLPESYFGTVTKYGLDIGSTRETVMRWLVLAPSTNIYAPGALAGNYIGASAEVTAGIGAGANVLVGGAGPSFTLQPVSWQTQKGMNLAVGVSQFELRSINN
ncbi:MULTISPECIES: DUF992 domain-containing protein [Mesorhizobium]|uniref:DUF992 domain-containing protein n=2 Tax=Mesorhizobium denitrificans TaxID=2294114 RepID=A0A371XCD5_9HYPH|nr:MULTISPECIES: DUF992 domain-containing protein [Mesorhizobium]RFC66898.1 DUF992 domain-containing protein [Mesorhizobium denitrificans]